MTHKITKGSGAGYILHITHRSSLPPPHIYIPALTQIMSFHTEGLQAQLLASPWRAIRQSPKATHSTETEVLATAKREAVEVGDGTS